MALPAEGVTWSDVGKHVIVLVLDADEAEGVADSLGKTHQRGHIRSLLLAWAEEARAMDSPVVWVPVGVPDATD